MEVGQTIHQVLITFRSPLSAFWAFFRLESLDFPWYLAERITPPAKSWKSSPCRARQRQAAAVSTDLHLCPYQGYSVKTRMQTAGEILCSLQDSFSVLSPFEEREQRNYLVVVHSQIEYYSSDAKEKRTERIYLRSDRW